MTFKKGHISYALFSSLQRKMQFQVRKYLVGALVLIDANEIQFIWKEKRKMKCDLKLSQETKLIVL